MYPETGWLTHAGSRTLTLLPFLVVSLRVAARAASDGNRGRPSLPPEVVAYAHRLDRPGGRRHRLHCRANRGEAIVLAIASRHSIKHDRAVVGAYGLGDRQALW
jgi:hypothetical protein